MSGSKLKNFSYRYVGLCASIKLVALAIFAVDWWLVRRRKQLEYPSPLSTNPAVGSIISLDKRTLLPNGLLSMAIFLMHNILLTVFAEKGVLDSQASPYTSDILSDDCGIHGTSFDVNTKKVLIASRHMRNDSKGIQLEIR